MTLVFLHGQYADELTAAVVPIAEVTEFLRFQGPYGGGGDFAEVGDDVRIDLVGLGQIAHGLGKVAHLARVDDDGGQSLGEQGAHGGFLIRTGGLEDDAFGGQGPNPRHEFGDAGGGVGELLAN